MNIKKLLALLLAMTMLFSLLAACGKEDVQDPLAQSTATDVPKIEETPAPTPETKPAATPEAAPEEESFVGLKILYEQDDSMINTYSLLAVNPEAPFVNTNGMAVEDVEVNTVGAAALVNWMLSEEGLTAAANYGYDQYGEYLFYRKDDAPVSTAEIPVATEETKLIRLSTTTSVNDSGLLGYLLPMFESKYGYAVEIYSAGTGKAIANAKMGNADAILVHSKSQEESFVDAGFAYVLDGFDSERLSFIYNFFVLCGPSADPAGAAACASVKDAFAAIAEGKYTFVSRGDASGTHTKEISLWPETLGITTEADSVKDYSDWYVYSNAGMGVCLTMANEQEGYILSDKATFLTFAANGGIMN